MKRLVLALVLFSLAGCVYVKNEAAAIRKRTAEEDAAIKKIRVTSRDHFSRHPDATVLGKVQGYCLADTPDQDTVASGASLKEAAYQKFGAKADGITSVRSWYVPTGDNLTAADDPLDPAGYFDCEGTAVTFQK
ncbi:MAG: hypothetical protein ACREQB_06905 [Candidatus Binataceae bacterium]